MTGIARLQHCSARLFLLAALVATGCATDAGHPGVALPREPIATAEASRAIPLDPSIRYARLPNGISYYILGNLKPAKRAELRLVVDAGSILEDDDQKGLAHFVEHMAFNGTKRFEKQELVNYLERVGMRFGPDINAYTSFDETVYMLEIPTDDPEIVSTALDILEDWASGIAFSDEEIDKERGVVVEEWRLGRGASGRIRDQQLPVLFHGSRYAERKTIGEKDVIETAPPDALKRFYRDWYRPDLMAVVAVGDFDADEIEKLVRARFERIPESSNPRPRVDFTVPDHDETLVRIVTDPEATSISAMIGFKREAVRYRTVAEVRNLLIDQLYDFLMNARLGELTRVADPPFQYGAAGSGSLGRTKSIYSLRAGVRDGGVERGLTTLLTEANRVRRYGFSPTELDRAKTDVLRYIDRLYEERDKRQSGAIASRLVAHFLESVPVPSVELLRDLFRDLVPGISLDEVNARANQWITTNNRIILVSGPDKEASAIPDETAVLGLFDAVEKVAVTPWVDRVLDEPLVASEPTAGSVVREEKIDSIGVTRWTLSNGAIVYLKPTEFQNDQIVLSGTSDGGTSLVSDDDYLTASMASSIIGGMGLGHFGPIELGKALSGKVAGAGASIEELSEGVSGGASVRDVETMFQLLYLRFTAPRADPELFAAWKTRMQGWLENQAASPGYHFAKKMNEIVWRDHPRHRFLPVDDIEKVDLDRALAFYRDRFADASDFTFTIVGNFELDSIRPLVETWIASLPAIDREETWKDVGADHPVGLVNFEVHKGIEPKTMVQIVFHGDAPWSLENRQQITTLAEVLQTRLREELREDKGGVYGVGVSPFLSKLPRERYTITISFGCDPARVKELTAATFAEIDRMRETGPDEDHVNRVKEAQRRQHETDLERNGFWASQIEWCARFEPDFRAILDFDELVDAVTPESIRDAARLFLRPDQFIEGVLYPEEASKQDAPSVVPEPKDSKAGGM